MNNGFLPEGYEPPQSGGNYMRFQPGENEFRILTSPITGWLDWKNNKPIRTPYIQGESAPKPIDPKKKVKHFWAMVVWNYGDGAIQVLEITQATIQRAILAYAENKKWGDPKKYDLTITKVGEDLETKYTVIANPKEAVIKEILEAFKQKPCDLNALFHGDDPFEAGQLLTPVDIEMASKQEIIARGEQAAKEL